jgi:hypothetical protein
LLTVFAILRMSFFITVEAFALAGLPLPLVGLLLVRTTAESEGLMSTVFELHRPKAREFNAN